MEPRAAKQGMTPEFFLKTLQHLAAARATEHTPASSDPVSRALAR
jgi:hypothetical protein